MLNYNAPNGTPSSIDAHTNAAQMNAFYYLKKAIIQARKLQFFSQISSVWKMPKHYGRAVRVYDLVPVLDDKNVNDQGIDATGATIANGNLYGSSRDVGAVNAKMPVLTENGGRVNRIGFTRSTREGSLVQFGFFYEFTEDFLNFDSMDDLKEHLAREVINAAYQMNEAVIQRDLLYAAGVTVYSGAAVSDATVTGEVVNGKPASLPTYSNFTRMEQILTDNRTPKQTTIITGTRNIDTKVVNACFVAYVGSELSPTLREIVDPFGKAAFVGVEHYAAGTTVLDGEIGKIFEFRIVQVPEMLHFAGAGAVVGTNPGYRTSMKNGVEHYDVFPILVVGEDSFQTIGFQSNGQSLLFNVKTKMPGIETAHADTDPYGLKGFSSIRWWYGTLIRRPERIGVIKCVAKQ